MDGGAWWTTVHRITELDTTERPQFPSLSLFPHLVKPEPADHCLHAGGPALLSGLERPPGEGNGSPLQYSYLENPMDGGAW